MAVVAEPAVEARGVTFSYDGGAPALTEVNFTVRAGESVALLAANGSGKTTLLKVLVGLLQPQGGEIRLFGTGVQRRPAQELYGQVGLVLQNPRDQLFCAVVEEDVAYGPRNLGWSESIVQQRVTEALAAVGALALRQRAVHRLSFGEQKRVAIAGVLAMSPRLLLVDEPTAGLDPQGEMQVLGLLRRLNQAQGITVVLATHSVDLLPLFVDRLCLLREGRVHREGSVIEVFADVEAMAQAHLRLPHVAALIDQLKRLDGVPIDGFPLTVATARQSLLALLDAMPRGAGVGVAATVPGPVALESVP
jgi:cobalt/nickel transport system ATP-binding protein